MKNINIKISRDFLLFFVLISLFGNAQGLDKDFRENFSKITKGVCYNSIDYSVDDITGFETSEVGKGENKSWEEKCINGKCEEYNKTVGCLFDDAFEKSVNQINYEVKNYTGEKLPELRDTELVDRNKCAGITLENTQERQSSLGFETTCEGEALNKAYSACRVTEAVLNELCGYEYFLTAKSDDYESFSRENRNDYNSKIEYDGLFRTKSYHHEKEVEKVHKSFIESSLLYKNFIHNYRLHAWLISIKDKLKKTQKKWNKIQKAIETFPGKFIDASSTGG